MERVHVRGGSIELITGSMFSGKTEELIRRLRRSIYAKQRIQSFKPQIDDRYSATDVISHDLTKIKSEVITFPEMIYDMILPETQVIGIDEAQFFDQHLVDVCQNLADQGIRVIVAGLDTDYRGRPFGCIPELATVAEFVTKQHAICVVCGSLASRTQRLSSDSNDILVGANEYYEARCRLCFAPPKRKQNSLPSESKQVKDSAWNI